MNKQEIVRIIELSWQAALEAEMEGQGPMDVGKDQFGNQAVNAVRLNTYYTVVRALLPQAVTQSIKVNQPKEPWQGEDDA